jgi:hypothetical protein
MMPHLSPARRLSSMAVNIASAEEEGRNGLKCSGEDKDRSPIFHES